MPEDELAGLLYLCFAATVGYVALKRQRGFVTWSLIALVISPLIAIIVLMIMEKGGASSKQKDEDAKRVPSETAPDPKQSSAERTE